MWNLKRLEAENYREHLDVAFPVGAIPEQVSEAEKDAVLLLYEKYVEKLGRPSVELTGEGARAGLLTAVHDAYNLVQDGRRLEKLRAALKHLAQLCPYCGFGQVEELDHVLQRVHYKLFSILPLNLVPCCGACNRGKRRVPSANTGEQQVHVYLEDVSAFDFLRADANIDAVTGGLLVKYSVVQSEGMSDDLYARLCHHLVEFRLHERYQKQVNLYLGGLEYPIASSFEKMGANGLKEFLDGMVATLIRREGANDWRTALMRGLAECPKFYEGGFRTALGLQPVDGAAD
ncbi:HNH endonuclease signature motif containing protein [Roseateles sp. DB2]|uniref:HNH endonuclease signature motif containing protein n=1 Tax=Roseateles sp. DB2 TaxID=3453717 RepID=UPI003EEE41DB